MSNDIYNQIFGDTTDPFYDPNEALFSQLAEFDAIAQLDIAEETDRLEQGLEESYQIADQLWGQLGTGDEQADSFFNDFMAMLIRRGIFDNPSKEISEVTFEEAVNQVGEDELRDRWDRYISGIDPSVFEQVLEDNVNVVWTPRDFSQGDEEIVLPELLPPRDLLGGGGGEEAGAQAPQEEVITDVTTEDTTGGSNSVYDAMDDSTVARQIHEAIILNPEIAGDLISEWEVYTGQTWDDSYINEDPYAGYEPPVSEPIQPAPEQEQVTQQPTEEGVTVGDILDAATTINTILSSSTDGSQTVTADGTATGTATEGTGTADGGAEGGAGGGANGGTGTGTGPGEGDGSGETTAEKAARSGFGDGFAPFYTSIGYQPVQMLAPVLPEQKDYMRELDELFNRTISNRKQGMLV